MKLHSKAITFLLVLLCGLILFGEEADAAVYRVDRYGELYGYSGSAVVPIKSNVSAIYERTFENVRTTRFVTSGNSYFKTIDGILYSRDGTVLVRCPSEKKGSVSIPSTVKKIAGYAFQGCHNIKGIVMTDSVTSIGEKAFRGCRAMTDLRISNNVKKFPYEMCRKCVSLSQLKFPSSLEAIGDSAFYDCKSLTSVTFPDSVSEIDKYCFQGCENLKTVRLSKKLRTIAEASFFNCTELRTVANTEDLVQIHSYAFADCENLKQFTFGNNLEGIGHYSFGGCRNLGTVTIGKNMEYISSAAFLGAAARFVVDDANPKYASSGGLLLNEEKTHLIQVPAALKGNVSIPKTVTGISNYALAQGEYSSVEIPEGIRKVSRDWFQGSRYVKKIILPSTVKEIRGRRYGKNLGLESLEEIQVSKTNDAFFSRNGVVYTADGKRMVFYPMGKRGNFFLPDTCKNLGRQMYNNKLTEIRISGNNKYFTVYDGVLYNLKKTRVACYPEWKKDYRMSKSLRSIGYLNEIKSNMKCRSVKVAAANSDFYSKGGVLFDADSDELIFYPPAKKGAYKVPSSARYINGKAFAEARKLTALTITKKVNRYSTTRYRFDNCVKLKQVVVKQGHLNYIDMNFEGCTKMKKLTFPSNIMMTRLRNLPEGIVIRGWNNTGAKESAREAGGKFVSLGTIPGVVSGARVRKIIDKYQLNWNVNAEADGYQIYTTSSTIRDIAHRGVTSCMVPGPSRNSSIYIRAYKMVRGKKVYGKAKRVSVGMY